MDNIVQHEEIKICFIPYTLEAAIKNNGKSYTEFYNDMMSGDEDKTNYISKYDIKTFKCIQNMCYYKLLEVSSLSEFRIDGAIEDGFLNNINMSINMDINDAIRFHVEDSVLFVVLNKGFFYFLNSKLMEFKDFFFNKILLNLFNFFTEDRVFSSALYDTLHDRVISSNYEKQG